jgi:anti-sigma regulatory factor (Ser/Thr protein kinase)
MKTYRPHRNFFKNYNSRAWENNIELYNLDNPRLVPEFINSIKRLHFKFKHNEINIYLNKVTSVYPYPTIPIVAIVEYFKKNLNVKINYIEPPTYLKKIHFFNPDDKEEIVFDPTSNYLDRIWTFKSSKDVHNLVDGFISSIRKSIECEVGVLDAFTWGFNEIMDNVIVHSEANIGFVMAQCIKDSKQVNVCIYDYGRGIYNSLAKSQYKPKNAADAISLAIQEGVTRDKEVGQGNGMWGLYNLVTQNDGNLSILSGQGGLAYSNYNKKVDTYRDVIMLSPTQQSTTVSFRLSVDKEISIKKAIKGYEMVDLFVENLENDFDQIEYKIIEQASGTGTRQSGERIRNELINIYKISKKTINIDFVGVGIISSSFADELIGKLIVQLGLFQFQNIFRLKNMNETIQTIVQRSVSQRMAESITKTAGNSGLA